MRTSSSLKISLLVIIIIVFQVSCRNNNEVVLQDNEISDELIDSIDVITTRIYSELQNNNLDYAISISNEECKKATIDMQKELAKRAPIIEGGNHRVINDFYIKNERYKRRDVVTGIMEELEYKYYFYPTGQATFIRLLSVPGTNKSEKMLISTVFNKNDNQWELINLNIGPFVLNDKTGIDYYELAIEKYKENQPVPANNYMQICQTLIKPAGRHLIYDRERSIDSFLKILHKKLNELDTFPIVIESIHSMPELEGVSTGVIHGYLCPEISYVSKSNSIVKENDSVHNVIEQYFKGITSISDSIRYIIGTSPNDPNPRVINKSTKQ